MQERKNKWQLIILVILIGLTSLAYWVTQKGEGDEVDKNIFRNYDLKTISEVILESPSGKVSLKYSGSRWKLNDQYNASPDMVEVLFATLQQAEPKRPLASALRDSVTTVLAEKGVKVSLLAAGIPEAIFYAGGNSQKTQAFFMDGTERLPYLMTIPGYRVYVSGIFELDESGWRDKFVFGFNWRNFQSLDVRFPGNPEADFVVAMENNYFSVQGLQSVDTTRLNDYLDDISLLTVDEYARENTSFDSLATGDPILKVSVKDIGRKEYVLEIYPGTGDKARYPGRINGSQWAFFGKTKVSGIIRRRDFFRKPD